MNTKPQGRGAGIRRASAGRALSVNADPATLRRLEYAALVVRHLTGTKEGNATMIRAAVRLLTEYLSQRLECANVDDPYCPEVGRTRVLMNRAAQGEAVEILGWPRSLTDGSGEPMTLDELYQVWMQSRPKFGLRELEDHAPLADEESLTEAELDAALATELRKFGGAPNGA